MFLRQWLASFFAIWDIFLEKKAVSTSEGFEHVEKEEIELQLTARKGLLLVSIDRNVRMADTRVFVSVAAMATVLCVSIYSFVVVFQGSATSRALDVINRLEQSNFAFSAHYNQAMAKLSTGTQKFEELSKEFEGDEDRLRRRLDVVRHKMTEISKEIAPALQEVNRAEISPSLSRDAQDLLLNVSKIKAEISKISGTNWDLIVVRTAIVLLSYFSLRILFKVFESAVAERRGWEERRSAISILENEGFQVGSYLALVGKLEEKDMSDFLGEEIDKLLEQLRKLKPGNGG